MNTKIKGVTLEAGTYTTVQAYADARGITRQAVMKNKEDKKKLHMIGPKTIIVKVK